MSATSEFRRIEPVDVYRPEDHTYWRNAMPVPGYSQIMKDLGFTEKLNKIPSGILERKARLGSAVDAACGLWDKGELDDESIHPAVRPYFDGYLKFRDEHKCEWFESQQFHIVDHQGLLYGITPDRIGLVDDDQRYSVLELKCTYNEQKSHRIQTAAQGACIHPFNLDAHHARRVLYLDGKGGYKLVEHKDHSADLLAWRQILATWYHRKNYA